MLLGALSPILTEAGYKKRGEKFFRELTSDIDVLIWPMTVPPLASGQLRVCLTLYVYSDLFARLGLNFAEPNREWYASAIQVYVGQMQNRRDDPGRTISSADQAATVGAEMVVLLKEQVLPLVERLKTAEDICIEHERHNYRLHLARPEVVKEWISRFYSKYKLDATDVSA